MNFPSSLWDYQLAHGVTLGGFVAHEEPQQLSLADKTSFLNVWQARMSDATAIGRHDLESKAKAIVRFISDHPEGTWLLLWPKKKLTALFSSTSNALHIIDYIP